MLGLTPRMLGIEPKGVAPGMVRIWLSTASRGACVREWGADLGQRGGPGPVSGVELCGWGANHRKWGRSLIEMPFCWNLEVGGHTPRHAAVRSSCLGGPWAGPRKGIWSRGHPKKLLCGVGRGRPYPGLPPW